MSDKDYSTLVITRNYGNQALIIKLPDGRRIKIKFLKYLSNKCRAVINAPRDITIFREEIEDKQCES